MAKKYSLLSLDVGIVGQCFQPTVFPNELFKHETNGYKLQKVVHFRNARS